MTDRVLDLADGAKLTLPEGKRLTKKVFVSRADMGPQLAGAAAAVIVEDGGEDTPEARAAKALGVELLGLSRERPLSRTWRARLTADGPLVALVVVADQATGPERELFARMAQDIHAAGEALPGILPARKVTPSGDAFLTDLWTTGSARDISALKWPPRRRVEFVLRTVRALDGLHSLGLVHGCLCPANVLLDDNLEPVIAEAGSVPVHAFVERGGDAALYAAFAAPEVTKGGTVDARSDLYSVGRILEDVTKGDESPAALEDIVKRCTYPDADARYASAAELATALEGIAGLLSDAETAAPPPAAVPPPARPTPERDRPARREPAAEARPAKESPAFAWQPPRVLGIAGIAAFAVAIAGSMLVGGSNDGFRSVLMLFVVVGSALGTTLMRPPSTATRKRGVLTQLALGVGCAAVVLVLDPLSLGYRMAAQRHLRGDDASKHAAIAEISRLGRDFRGLSLANVDLSGQDLSGADLRGVDLSHANLAHTRLFGAEVQGASFDGASLAGAGLEQVELQLATVGAATCDGDTHLPHGWRCRDGYVARAPAP
jgi:hypothetical protein